MKKLLVWFAKIKANKESLYAIVLREGVQTALSIDVWNKLNSHFRKSYAVLLLHEEQIEISAV